MKWLQPELGTLRKKFAWLPTRVCVTYAEYRCHPGWKLIPFVQGWHHGLGLAPYTRPRAKKQAIPSGGMVADPAVWIEINELNGWIWLEWYLVSLRRLSSDSGNKTWTKWIPERMPQQWNLWHEYD